MRWTSDFAYVIGLITTDGNLSSDGRHINFTSKDYEQVQHFKEILNLSNKIGKKGSGSNKPKDYFVLQFGDVKFYKFLLSIGLHPRKSKTIKKVEVPDEYFSDFLRGCLDGDGYSHSYWDKRWKSSFLLYIGFVSASRIFLEWLRNKISVLYEIRGTIRGCGRSAHQLVFAKQASIQLIKKIYYSNQVVYLGRKKWKIDNSLSIIAQQCRDAEMVDGRA